MVSLVRQTLHNSRGNESDHMLLCAHKKGEVCLVCVHPLLSYVKALWLAWIFVFELKDFKAWSYQDRLGNCKQWLYLSCGVYACKVEWTLLLGFGFVSPGCSFCRCLVHFFIPYLSKWCQVLEIIAMWAVNLVYSPCAACLPFLWEWPTQGLVLAMVIQLVPEFTPTHTDSQPETSCSWTEIRASPFSLLLPCQPQ